MDISIIYIFIIPVVCDWFSMVTLRECVTADFAWLHWILYCEWRTNSGFHLMNRCMAGPDIVYMRRYENNTAEFWYLHRWHLSNSHAISVNPVSLWCCCCCCLQFYNTVALGVCTISRTVPSSRPVISSRSTLF
jgi:hypothetical protein